MLKWLKEIWYGRPETEEEREIRQEAHRVMLISSAGLRGVRIEENNEDDKVFDDTNADGRGH